MGLIRYKDAKFQRLNVLRGYLILLYVLLFNVTQYFYIYENRNNLIRLTSRGGSVFMYSSLIMKGLTILIYHNKYCEVLNYLHITMKNIQESDNYEIQLILSKCIRKNNVITRAVMISAAFTVIVFNIYMIFSLFVFAK